MTHDRYQVQPDDFGRFAVLDTMTHTVVFRAFTELEAAVHASYRNRRERRLQEAYESEEAGES